MALIDATFVKGKFPQWEKFCDDPDAGLTTDQMLQIAIDQAEAEYQEFVDIDDSTVTDAHRWLILKIVKYNAFQFKHGDQTFEHKPAIVKDYERLRDRLEKGLVTPGATDFETKDRIMDDWFTDQDNLWYESS